MKIETQAFGFIVIDGKRYTSDLVIYPDGRVKDSWHRKSGHTLSSDDIIELIESGPEVIIAGTGVNGRVRIEEELENILSRRGIDFFPAPNEEAIDLFNDLVTRKRVAVGACFHLTC